MMSEIFSVSRLTVTTSDFIRVTEQGRRVITTASIPQYLTRWKSIEHASLYDGTGRSRVNAIYVILQEVSMWINRFCDIDSKTVRGERGFKPDYWPLTPEVSLSIMSLGSALSWAVSEIWKSEMTDEIGEMGWGTSETLINRLLQDGWCPYDVTQIRLNEPLDRQYFFASIPPCRNKLFHSNCNESVCIFDKIDKNKYETKHVQEFGGCHHAGPDLAEILAFLRNGGIPAVQWTRSRDYPGFRLNVTEVQPQSRFVAISHVWGDGLGNAWANTLPACQLHRIQSLVDAAHTDLVKSQDDVQNGTSMRSEHISFWIDTLCVPVNVKHRRDRDTAILRMRHTYDAAEIVLALDADLLHCSRDAPTLELFPRLVLFRWTRRLWPLQEAILAKRLLLQCSDGLSHLMRFMTLMPPLQKARCITT